MSLSSCEREIFEVRSIGSRSFGSKEALKMAAGSLMEAVRMIENFNNKDEGIFDALLIFIMLFDNLNSHLF